MATKAAARAAGEGSADSGCSAGRSTGPRLGRCMGRPPAGPRTVLSCRVVQVVAVVPTYDEAENLVELVVMLRKAVPGIRVLVVDDDSPDGTADVARALAAEHGDLEVLVRHDRRGLGSAYRDGFRQA